MKPIQNSILDLIGERISNIKLINGYHYDVEKIKRETIGNFTGKELPIIFYWSEADTRIEARTNCEQRVLPIYIAGFFKTRDNNFNDEAFNFGFDIYTAIHRNPNSPNVIDPIELDLGCKFISNVNVTSIAPMIGNGDQPYAGVLVGLEINFKFSPGLMTLEVC